MEPVNKNRPENNLTERTKAVAVLPARLASTRLPRKVLADIHGHPLLWYVWRRAKEARSLDEVLVVTDSEEVCHAVEDWGGVALMTSPECRSGTERIASVLDQIPGELIVNIQGDEPLIDPLMIDRLVETWHGFRQEKMSPGNQSSVISTPGLIFTPGVMFTPVYPITDLATLLNPNVVKVARGRDGCALYFSRSPIPYMRDLPQERWLDGESTRPIFWGHVGVYGYPRQVLAAYGKMDESLLEPIERLEQLRFLEAGYQI
jgi:3-deoxy-manno-octulosonate cytidylyltransferase (CMP-KDO synthetase)